MEENEKYFFKYCISFKATVSHSEFHFLKSICQHYYVQQYCVYYHHCTYTMEITSQLRK